MKIVNAASFKPMFIWAVLFALVHSAKAMMVKNLYLPSAWQ